MYSTARLLTEEGIEGLGRYYSIYRGIVVDNNDTEKHMNRIKVCCPEVMGGIITWAYAKGQHGSINNGFKYLAPKVGDIVFVTFEFGDPTKPLWEYHGWGLQQVPDPLDGPNKMGIITPEGNLMVLDDDNGSDLNRTRKVYQALEEICYEFDLSKPLWLDHNKNDFIHHSKTRFNSDSFVEDIDFDFLEIQVIEED